MMRRLSVAQVAFISAWVLSCTGAIWAQESPDYWPLEVGNRWAYRHIQVTIEGEKLPDEMVTLEVVSRRRIEEKDYFELSNGQLLRKNEEGSIVERRDEIDVIIFDMNHLDDPQHRFYIPSDAFPLTGGGGSGYPASRWSADPDGHPVGVTVPAGTFPYIIHFGDGDLAAMFAMILAEDVGPVIHRRYTDLPNYVNVYELIEYRIGGINYPTMVREISWAEVKEHLFLSTLDTF